ncbi:hypothetical protein TetV_405 [Tetraselmis virus 1]|uniref:Uncharacterized protein n=1 Tax=Tetraselmis virus 1 TaxID=2060617 RepID=A0A2P0VNK2_9VIRU|nr:hypothetical protein QJ968_gp649 [Tetraselmis virus 1]AUF82487.1 hypothetical protein TetV_405 [Tetraselmis virus 1]
MNKTASIIGVLLLASMVAVSANGPSPKKSLDEHTSCKAAQTCYYSTVCRDWDLDKEHKDDKGIAFRKCFMQCLKDRVPNNKKGNEFMNYVQKVDKWCENKKRDNDAPQGKVRKCVVHKIKKDVCEEYFPSETYDYYYDK